MQAIKYILLFLIKLYQLLIAPLIPASCRYFPTCSVYAKEAIIKHGPFYGTYLAIKRVLSCHPWGGHGFDPVP